MAREATGARGGSRVRVPWTPVSTPRPSSSAPFCDEWRRDRILPKRWLAGQVSPEGKSPVTHSLTPRCEHPVPAPLLETVGEMNPNRPRGWEVPARGSGVTAIGTKHVMSDFAQCWRTGS